MADDIKALLAQAPFSFVGTVVHLSSSLNADLPIDERTAVVSVDHVLHAPDAFARLEGHQITVQFAATADPPATGESLAIFAQGLSFGETIAVTEVGRLPVDAVEPHAQAAVDNGAIAGAFDGLIQEMNADNLRSHMQEADAVVLGRVVGAEKVGEPSRSEHDPHWWRVTIAIDHVETGAITGDTVQALFANSEDVRWKQSPKPRAGQHGLWLLHKTDDVLGKLAPYQLLHPEDVQPVQQLELLRTGGA